MSERAEKGLRVLALVLASMFFPLLAWSAWTGVAQVLKESPAAAASAVTSDADNLAAAIITLEQARRVALDEFPGATFDEAELDEEDGYLVYDIELKQDGQEIEITINAEDASVLEIERDDD